MLVVLVGFGIGSLFGYKGGVILVVGNGFSNSLTQYDDFAPGGLFKASRMEPFCFTVHDFKVDWLETGPRQGMARGFQAPLTYRESCQGDPSTWSAQKSYDLRVNHPLTIGGTQIFLIGHGYAPVITVRDAAGHKVYDGPTIFLPESANFESFGVVKAPGLTPGRDIGLEGLFYPTYALVNGNPVNVMGDDRNPTLSMLAYVGDLGLDSGVPQSVYAMDKAGMTQLKKPDGKIFRHLPAAPPDRRAARRGRHRHLPRGQALDAAADQPHPRRVADPARRDPGTGRPARLAVHPAPTSVGPGATRRRHDARRGGRTGPVGRR